MRYLNSPSTLRAPDAPAWPARTEARAVFEVLLATAGTPCRGCAEDSKTVTPDRSGQKNELPGGGSTRWTFRRTRVADSLAHRAQHRHHESHKHIATGHTAPPAPTGFRGRRGRRTSVSGRSYVPTRGVIYVHSSPLAVSSHVEWAI